MFNVLRILLVILFLPVIIVLQIFLSKRRNRWLGLLLPAISLLSSIMMVLNMVAYPNESLARILTRVTMVFLLSNIPTAVLIAIYYACREKLKKNKELDRMNIQDLE